MKNTATSWDTGYVVPEDRRNGYTHLIRSPDDPKRSPRPKGGWKDRAPHLTLRKANRLVLGLRLLEVLGEQELTLNSIAVLGWDLTADVVFTTPINDILWDLVEQGVLEHSMKAPILFRKVRA